MKTHFLFLFLFFLCARLPTRGDRAMTETYKQRRDILLGRDKGMRLGSDVILDPHEEIVNEQLMKNKRAEMAGYLSGAKTFPPGHSFTEVKQDIEKSKVYKFIRKMPKECMWSLVADERRNFTNGTRAFDDMLVKSILFGTSKIVSSRGNSSRIWQYFEEYFLSVTGLLLYNPVFLLYVYEGLKELWEDNIQHFEIRASLQQTYSLDGRHSSPHAVIQQYIQGIRRFRKLHCHLCRVQLIICLHRSLPAAVIKRKLYEAAHLQRMYPDLVAGFDLVGHEDGGRSLLSFMPELKSNRLPFFFHAGETNWQGTATDENLIDALLLRVKRIGHGYAILKHPAILEKARMNQIPIEVCPISNQILGLLNDLRNHPASSLIASNFPIVVSSDDPATWNSTGLSHDLYVIFMAIAGARDDLRLLKKLALNSIRFSSLPIFERKNLQDDWISKWRLFIENEAKSLHINATQLETNF